MERILIVNADDFGLSKGQNYGIIEACRNGLVTSTTALVNGAAIHHAVELSRRTPALGVGMHFTLTMGEPLSAMPGLARDGRLGKWLWQMAEQGSLPLDEVLLELSCQYQRFFELFGRKPTHIDSHHHIHMLPAIYPLVAEFARQKGIPIRSDRGSLTQAVLSSDAFSSEFYGETVSEALFLQILDTAIEKNVSSLEVMCHPSFVDNIVMESTYCYPRLAELDILTSPSLIEAVKARGFILGNYQSLISSVQK